MSGDSSRHGSSRQGARSNTGSEACVARWNTPSNARPRALMNRAALASATAPGVGRRVLIQRYAGPPLEDVGVGESGVNASRGQCLIAHASNVLFLYSRGAWRQVGYSPGLAFAGIPQRAARSPNATLALQAPGEPSNGEAGTIQLTP